jgi:carbamoyltransferase
MVKILGLSDSKTESGIAYYKGGKLEFALNEERITRKKLDGGFPYKSLDIFYKLYEDDLDSIDQIVFAGILTPVPLSRIFNFLLDFDKKSTEQNDTYLFGLVYRNISYVLNYKLKLFGSVNPNKKIGKFKQSTLKYILSKRFHPSLKDKPILFLDHHLCHASAAYFSSGFNESLTASFDGYGDGYSGKIYISKEKSIKEIFSIDALDSFGLYYSLITEFLGFIPERHEGKITGLAAYGKHENVKEKFPFILSKSMKPKYVGKGDIKGLKDIKIKFSQYCKEDVAAWLQYNVEKYICSIISHYMIKHNQNNICLAGGLFANVKLNQKISELKEVNEIYIYPAMSDMGISHGGILFLTKEKEILKNVFYGPEYTNRHIEKILTSKDIKYEKPESIAKEIARLLSEGKIIARFNGRMEYGPRALGNRSILVQAIDNSINEILNNKLQRTEFMPFAPTILEEYASKCIKNLDKAQLTSKFMNISFNATGYMKKNFPAAVHVDGTLRPQILSKEDNQDFYNILLEYNIITKNPVILNTSFNMHEEPIVMTPSDALRAFKQSGVDYLAIGNLIIEK